MATYCEEPILLTGTNFRVTASTERASLLIYSGAVSRPFAVEFKDAGSLDHLIEQLTRARYLAWPGAGPFNNNLTTEERNEQRN